MKSTPEAEGRMGGDEGALDGVATPPASPAAAAPTPGAVTPPEAETLLSPRSQTVVKFGAENHKTGGRWTVGPGALEDDEEWTMEPPDGGWGWFVLLGATMVNVLVPGTVKSFGVLFVEFLSAFRATPTAAAWIPALCYFLYSSLGPLSSILSVRWSYRTVTLLGGTFAALGMMLSFWADSVTYLYVSYGVLVGTGAGLSFPPTVYIVSSYFTRRRGLANGICMSGSALGSIVLPPALRLMLKEYGYHGAVLLMGGLTLNVWAAALLFQPVERHLVRAPPAPPRDAYADDDLDGYPPKYDSPETIHEEKDDKTLSSLGAMQTSPSERRRRRLSPAMSAPRIRSSHSLALQAVPEDGEGDGGETARASSAALGSAGPPPPRRSASTSSFHYMSTPFHGSTLSAFERPSEFASQLTLRSVGEGLRGMLCCGRCRRDDADDARAERNRFFDASLLRNPVYLIILISNCTNAISYTNFIILLPSYAISIGFDADVSAALLSIVSLLDLVGRIGGSALSDTELAPKAVYFVGGLLLSGLALAATPLTQSYAALAACCAVFGLASGAYVGTTAIIMAERLGQERLTSTYGISLFVNGLLQLAGPPACGLWFERTHSYASLFVFLGGVLVSGAALWLLMPFVDRAERERRRSAA